MAKVECMGCRYPIEWNGETDVVCPKCGEVLSGVQTLLESNVLDRLGVAAGFRRVGRFDDAQQELENLLERDPDLTEALFGCFLNAYEVTEYAFDASGNGVKVCKCNSTSRRPVERNIDWQDAQAQASGKRLAQWKALGEEIEKARHTNLRIKESLPLYRAIITCDYTNATDMDVAYGLYEILSKKTDVFFAPVTLQNVPPYQREKYFVQAIKNPEVAPLMFVVYSDAFDHRTNAKNYMNNVLAQCRDFARVHTKQELFSVTCDCEPAPQMKTISIKNILCEDFEKETYAPLAEQIMEYIICGAYTEEEYREYLDGADIIPLNDGSLSPKVNPV